MTRRMTQRTHGWLERHRALVRVVAVSLMALLVVGNTPARAQRAFDPPELLNPFRLNDSTSFYLATPVQYEALKNLQFTAKVSGVPHNAIANTLRAYGLPDSDARAVQTWARNDALAELFGLLVEAIKSNDRLEDQGNAVAWLKTLLRRQAMMAAYHAGLEYVKWAGLRQDLYDYYVFNEVFTDPNNVDFRYHLETFLDSGFTSPQDYAAWTDDTNKIGTATEGFCVYQPPAPFQDDYTGNIYTPSDRSTAASVCFTPDPLGFCFVDCIPDHPEYEDFVKWGEAVVIQGVTTDSVDFTEIAHAMTAGLGIGGIVASVATGVTVASTLGPVLSGTAFQRAIFPFARVVNSLRSYATLGRTIAALDGGLVAADAAGSIMGGVILFVTGTTEESIAIDSALNLPKKLASLIEGAPATDIDPGQLLNSTSGTGELYALFVNASAPSPSIAELGSNSANGETAFLNPDGAPLPDPQTDPEFVVTVNGAVNPQASISWYDVASQTTNTARLHESWFVVRSTDNQGNPATVAIIGQTGQSPQDIQSLHISYTDWAGVEHVAGLLKPSSGGYKFISITQSGDTPLVPSTCLTDGTCGYADAIQYVDAAGNQYSARVADPVQAVPPRWRRRCIPRRRRQRGSR